MCKLNIQPHNIACFASLICFTISLIFLYVFAAHNEDKNSYHIEVSTYTFLLGFILYVIKTNIKKECRKKNTKVYPEKKKNTKVHPIKKV